ncbi:MAG: 3'(2'),5'-bisphosphate nucleotidase CysQ [Bacilli bacterium]|nr:3'(2'),5'-bisphosphate nucleotidase CysQ [Bacilli bacterium]
MWEKELEIAIEAALEAEKWIMEVYSTDFEVEIKSDDSPVTKADKGADKIIVKYIKERFPNHAFLTEESKDNKSRLNNDFVWIVDPVDGTTDFVSKNGEFTTNIALCYKHEIVVGVINAPAQNKIYYASKGNGAYLKEKGKEPKRIHVSDKVDNLTVLNSRSHLTEQDKSCVERHKEKIANIIPMGAALKFGAIAEGKAEISFRFSGGTKEWDTASGTIILKEAGGNILTPKREEMTYNRDDVYNRDGYVLFNRIENFMI